MKNVFRLMLCAVLPVLFVSPINLLFARAFNNDFETGDLTDWEKTETAFDFQPTWGITQRLETVDSLLIMKAIGGWDLPKNIKVPLKARHSDRIRVISRMA